MTTPPDPAAPQDELSALRERADALERELRATLDTARARTIRAELKAEAVRAGMVDLDGLKLIDPSELTMDDHGEVQGAASLMQTLRRTKPWLFAPVSSSAASVPPPSAPPRARLATDMTLDEWRAARAEMLKRR